MVRSRWATVALDPETRVDELVENVRVRHEAGLEIEFQWTAALSGDLIDAIAAVIEAARDTALRVFSGDGGGPQFEWLSGLERARHLKVECATATTFEALGRFPDLRSLFLGSTMSKRPSLEVLATMPQLRSLRVDGHVKGAEAISELKQLRYLQVGGARDPQWLVRVGPHPTIEELTIGLGSIRDLSALPGYPTLESLRLVRVSGLTQDHLAPVAACRVLKKLSLCQLKHVGRLPDLSGDPAGTIDHVALMSMHNLETLSQLLSLKKLKLLQLTDTVPQDQRIRDFGNIDGLHLIVDDRYPSDELESLLTGYKGSTLDYRGEFLVGTREERAAAAAELGETRDKGPVY